MSLDKNKMKKKEKIELAEKRKNRENLKKKKKHYHRREGTRVGGRITVGPWEGLDACWWVTG